MINNPHERIRAAAGDNFWGDLFMENFPDTEYEAGLIFEDEVFGEYVWRSNAGIILGRTGGLFND